MKPFFIGVMFAASAALMSCTGVGSSSAPASAPSNGGSSFIGTASLPAGGTTIAYYIDGQGQVVVCRSNHANTSCAPAEVQASGGQGNYRGLGAASLVTDGQSLAYYLDGSGHAIVCRSNAANTSCAPAERQASDAP